MQGGVRRAPPKKPVDHQMALQKRKAEIRRAQQMDYVSRLAAVPGEESSPQCLPGANDLLEVADPGSSMIVGAGDAGASRASMSTASESDLLFLRYSSAASSSTLPASRPAPLASGGPRRWKSGGAGRCRLGSGGSSSSPSQEAGDEFRTSFSQFEGRGHDLHTKFQDFKQTEKFAAFTLQGPVGGTLMKKYDQENVKHEAFIDIRWHRELLASVEGEDLWVLQEADREVIHPLTSWQEEQWRESERWNVVRWGCAEVGRFLDGLFGGGEEVLLVNKSAAESADRSGDAAGGADLGDADHVGEREVVRSEDETACEDVIEGVESRPALRSLKGMTGSQLARLGASRLVALLGDKDGRRVHTALEQANRDYKAAQTTWMRKNQKRSGLGLHKAVFADPERVM